jgi:hypothetical protein
MHPFVDPKTWDHDDNLFENKSGLFSFSKRNLVKDKILTKDIQFEMSHHDRFETIYETSNDIKTRQNIDKIVNFSDIMNDQLETSKH